MTLRQKRRPDARPRTGLHLLFLLAGACLAASPATAATATYRWQISNGQSYGGYTTNWTESCGTNVSVGALRVTTMTTAAFPCSVAGRISDTTQSTPFDLLLLIKPTTYTQDTAVTGQATGNRWYLRDPNGGGKTVRLALGYVLSGSFTSFGFVDVVVPDGTAALYLPDMSGISGTAPGGSNLALRVTKQAGNTNELRIYLADDKNSGDQSGQIFVDETAACVPTGSLSVTAGQTLGGDPVDLTSISTLSNATNVVYTVNEGACGGGSFDQLDSFTGLAEGTRPGFGNWTGVQGSDGTLGWVVHSGATGSGSTGPSSGNPDPCVYLESSATNQTYGVGVSAGSSQYVESNPLDAGAYQLKFEFDWNMNVNNNADASLHVDVKSGTTWDLDVTGGAINTGDNGNVWVSQPPIDLYALGYTSGSIQIRIRYVVGNGTIYRNDVAIDNLHVFANAPAPLFTGDEIQAQSVSTAGWAAGTKCLTITGDDVNCGTALAQAQDTFTFVQDSLTVGDGTDPGSQAIAPGGVATELDAFTLQTQTANDTVTAVSVTLAAGTWQRLGLLEITSDDGATVYGSAAPAGDVVNVTLSSTITATSAPAQYKVRITPASHAAMPAPPGASYAVTGTVTGVTSTFGKTYNDTLSATVTIDNLSPANASWGTVTPGNGEVVLSWTNPGDADFSEVVILRSTATIADAPTEGASYAQNDTIGASVVRYIGSLQNFTDTGLLNGQGYFYKIFARDTSGNYATGAETGPHTPTGPTTVVGDGTNPVGASLIPGDGATMLDAFTLQSSVRTDTVIMLTVSLAPGTSAGLSLLEVTSDDGAMIYGSIVNPTSDAVSVVLSPSLLVTTSAVQYKVRITPHTHASMPAPPGASYAVTGAVTAIVSGLSPFYNDASSATVTIDNLSPAEATWGIIRPSDQLIELGWTNPATDFAQVVILRSAASISDRPTEGATYAQGDTIGASVIRYVGALQTFTDVGLTNGQNYYYKIFAKDGAGNYSATGAQTGPHTPALASRLTVSDPGQPTGGNIAAGTAGVLVGRLQVEPDAGSIRLTGVSIKNTGTAAAGTEIVALQLFSDQNANGTLEQSTDALLGTATWSATDGAFVFSGLTFDTTAGTPRTLLVSLSAARGLRVGRTFAMQVLDGDVTVQSPDLVNAFATINGNAFTFTAGASAGSADGSAPTVQILNPLDGGAVSGTFLVQIQVYNPGGLAALSAIDLSTDGGSTYPVALHLTNDRNNHYSVGTDAAVYQTQLTVSPGAYSLVARAQNTVPLSATSLAAVVAVNPLAARGDGHLLVRDNSSQLCADCHALPSHSSQHTGGKYGAWAVRCRDCHTPHRTTNIFLINETIQAPNFGTYSGARTVRFWETTGATATGQPPSYVNPANDGPCQVCHTRTQGTGGVARWRNTGNADTHYTSGATQRCTNCHLHTAGFGGGESKGGATCSACHAEIWAGMTGGVGKTSKHSLASVLGTNDAFTDSGLTWSAPLSGNAAAVRSCVNMCHQDHVHNQVNGADHAYNVHEDAANSTSRAVTRDGNGAIASGTPARTDFDAAATNGGMCISCHRNPISAGGPTVAKTTFQSSTHNYTLGAYTLHDNTTFARNCLKCHADSNDGRPSDSTTPFGGIHYSDNPDILTLARNPAGSPGGFICYDCHGNGTVGQDQSGKDLATLFNTKASTHPVNADSKHDGGAEVSIGYNAGTFSGGNRHVSCLDCHNPHASGNTLHTQGTNAVAATSPIRGASGVTFTPPATNWAATASGDFSWTSAVTKEYETCFKCHTSFAFGGAPPTGQTDVAQELSTSNQSYHPVVGPLPTNDPGTNGSSQLQASQLNNGWTPGQTMYCSDCHGNDAASPAIQGPHGSAVSFVLKGPNTNWPTTSAGGGLAVLGNNGSGFAGVFCLNCHPIYSGGNWANGVHKEHEGRGGGVACIRCHILVPHGGKMSRLIGDTNGNMPARYAYQGNLSNMWVRSFTKASGPNNYSKSNCGSGAGGCTKHQMQNGNENW